MNYSNLETIKKEFQDIKKMEYVKSIRKGEKGALITFKSLLKKDYPNVEFSIMHNPKNKYISLFGANQEDNFSELKKIKDKYGYYNLENKSNKVIETIIQANCSSLVGTRFLFKLKVNYEEKRIYLIIMDKYYAVLEQKLYWPFSLLERRIKNKFKHLVLVKAWAKVEDEHEYYKYYDLDFYEIKNLNEIIKLIEDGTIRLNFKINVYKKGKNIGKINDRKMLFEIQDIDLYKLYNKIYF